MTIDVLNYKSDVVTIATIDDLITLFGLVTPTPVANTMQDRLKQIQTLLNTGNTTLAALLTGPLLATLQAAENHIGAVGGTIANVTAAFSRPANTTGYTSGQLIANDTVAGNVVPMSFAAPRVASGTGKIPRARVKTNDTGFAGKAVRLHLYRDQPTVTNGDGGTWLSTESGYLGGFDVTLDKHFSDPIEKGIGVPLAGSAIYFTAANTATVIYGLLEARAAITPISGSAFVCTLEIEQN